MAIISHVQFLLLGDSFCLTLLRDRNWGRGESCRLPADLKVYLIGKACVDNRFNCQNTRQGQTKERDVLARRAVWINASYKITDECQDGGKLTLVNCTYDFEVPELSSQFPSGNRSFASRIRPQNMFLTPESMRDLVMPINHTWALLKEVENPTDALFLAVLCPASILRFSKGE